MDVRGPVWAEWRALADRALRRARTDWLRLPTRRAAVDTGERARAPGVLLDAEPTPGGGVVHFARSSLRVRVLAGGAVFLGWDGARPEPSHALAGSPPPADHRARLEPDTNGGWRVVSERTLVVITRVGAVEVRTPGGVLLRRDLPPRWWERSDSAVSRWVLKSEVASDAGFFGLGGWASGPCLPDGTYQLGGQSPDGRRDGTWSSPVPMPVQLVVADSGSHLVFHDNAGDGEVTLRKGTLGEGSNHDRPGRSRAAMAGPLRYWVVPGTPARVLYGWSQLTGAAVVPPDWALGYQHAVDRRSGGSPQGVVASFAEHGMRLTGVHLAGSPMTRQLSGDGRGDGELRALTADLARRGTGVVQGLSSAVAVAPGEEWYDRGRSAGLLVGGEGRDSELMASRGAREAPAFPDFTEPGTREWWGKLYQPYLELGVRGFWHEPAGDETNVVRRALPRQAGRSPEGQVAGEDSEAHSIAPLAMASAGSAAVREARLGEPAFVLSSASGAGMQRYGGVLTQVSGDWAGLRATLATVLGLGLSGVPHVGVDVGGAGGRISPELYLRWFQLGAFLPLFRTRSTTGVPREPWRYGDDVAKGAAVVCARRERLMPYLVTLAQQASVTGAPIVRPVWWRTPSDRQLRACDDAYLLGDALLVAPVLQRGATHRDVRLPPGVWYDTATGQAHEGGCWVTVEAPLSEVPVLARAGSVIPLATEGGGLELEVWAALPGRICRGLMAVGDEGRERQLLRLSVRTVAGTPVVVREDGQALDLPVHVRGSAGVVRGDSRAQSGG